MAFMHRSINRIISFEINELLDFKLVELTVEMTHHIESQVTA